MFLICGSPKSIEDLAGKTFNPSLNQISNLRNQAKVLVIDDNYFAQKDNLQSHGYNIHYESDLSSLTIAEGFQIILCDLQGVGKKLGGDSGGFLIK